MVRFTVLASGSKGNSTVVSGGRTRILVDAGLSCRELFRRMRAVGEEPERLDAIIVTHEHQDHVSGLSVTARKLGIPVYFTEATYSAWKRWITPHHKMSYAEWREQGRKQAAERQAEAVEAEDADPEEREAEGTLAAVEAAAQEAMAQETAVKPAPHKADPSWLPAVEHFQPGKPFTIGDISVSPFTTPHDAVDPVGFVLGAEGIRIGYATDLGYIPPNVREQLRELNLLLIESNHDLEMLRDGPYPWSIKQRVLSRVGHLSNDATAEFLSTVYDGRASYIILGHISENNNLPELVRVSAERALSARPSLVTDHLLLARQREPLSSICF
jgi:phosphoribosyl 1,2-cyclic phosphodiesterase